ncbi:FHA domain protein [Planctomycetes bacterium Pla163]|uniref:FHA domain protein n=1 Tax=Rohdeia mirabilis TaxID=2528008 RepID=A0A518D2B4_9BACT|nr:FHA domain protein [Planctomycetes bacterium Pla163]
MIRLVPTEGPGAGRPVQLDDGARIGRLPACELVVVHGSVSRVHARIERRGERWFCVDAGSRNGLFAGGERVAEVELTPGLELLLGEFPLRVEAPASGAAAPAGDVIEDDFEFDLDGPAPPAPQAAAAAPRRAPAQRNDPPADDSPADDSGGFEFEEPAEIQVGSTASKAAAKAAAPAGERSGLSQAQVRSAQFLAEESQARSGLVRGELTQQPAWIQALTYVGVLAFAGALAFGAYVLVS